MRSDTGSTTHRTNFSSHSRPFPDQRSVHNLAAGSLVLFLVMMITMGCLDEEYISHTTNSPPHHATTALFGRRRRSIRRVWDVFVLFWREYLLMSLGRRVGEKCSGRRERQHDEGLFFFLFCFPLNFLFRIYPPHCTVRPLGPPLYCIVDEHSGRTYLVLLFCLLGHDVLLFLGLEAGEIIQLDMSV